MSPQRGRVVWCLLIGVVFVAFTAAAEPSIEVLLDPQKLGVEDTARLVVTIKNSGKRSPIPALGKLDNFEVAAGPSTENRFSWFNGQASSETVFTYILQPKEVGPARVGSVGVSLGDAVLKSDPIQAEVVAGSVAPPRRHRRTRPMFHDPMADLIPQQRETQAKILIHQVAGSQQVYVGEPLEVEITLDSNIAGVEGFEWLEAPTYPGCWTQQVDLHGGSPPEMVQIEGERFQRFTIARSVVVPLKPGELIIPAASARIGVRSRSMFARQQVVNRATDEIPIQVKERPAPPAGFSGAVGQLRYESTLEPQEIEFGESAVLTITLSGNGNLPLVESPAIWPSCEGCDTYPPEEDGELIVDEDGMHGHRSWQMTVVPRASGKLNLDPVELAVFDPAAGHYRSQSLGPLALQVNPPPPTPTPSPAAMVPKTDPGGTSGANSQEQVSTRMLWTGILAALFIGVAAGACAAWIVARRSAIALPARRPGATPADRARELQNLLEQWWFGIRDRADAEDLRTEMVELRRDIESVRFAPGRADHSETIAELEERYKELLRKAR